MFKKHSHALQYHSIYYIKIPLNIHNFHFWRLALRAKFDIATLRAERAEIFGIFLTFAPPPPSEKWIDATGLALLFIAYNPAPYASARPPPSPRLCKCFTPPLKFLSIINYDVRV